MAPKKPPRSFIKYLSIDYESDNIAEPVYINTAPPLPLYIIDSFLS